MDLETIGKKMLEALAVRGQVASMDSKLSQLRTQKAQAEERVVSAKKAKEQGLLDKAATEINLSRSITAESEAQKALVSAQTAVENSKKVVDKFKTDLEKFNESALAKLDEAISLQEVEAKEAEKALVDAGKELEVLKKDLLARQSELKNQGVEFDITGVRQPQTTVL